jgi:pyridoxal phosphate enzyme (YggS family)
MTIINGNLLALNGRIRAAAQASGRAASAVTLVAVSKGHDVTAVNEALQSGQRVYGENRVQEAQAKFALIKTTRSDLELHLIGPLQTNKAEDAVKLFDVIQTLDRPQLAEVLVKAIAKSHRTPRLYVEVNIGHESQKAGIEPAKLSEFLYYCRETCGLKISGLMCIPPQSDDPQTHFLGLKLLADQNKLAHVSMGMSADFETAIRCGATEIRVGNALFGPRPKHP